MKNKIIVGLLLLGLVATVVGCSEATTTATTQATTVADSADDADATTVAEGAATQASGEKTVLVMATNAEFPPYEYHDNDQIVGIDVEIAQAIAEQMGCELEIEDIAFDSIIPEVTSGKADFGAAGMTVTEDRLQNVDFSDTYASSSQVIIVTEDSDITGVADLAGKIVGVQQGTTGDIYCSDDATIGDGNVERFNKGMEAVQSLSQGKVDAVVIDIEPAKEFVAQTEGLKILDETYTEEEYAIAVKKGNTELLEQINIAIAELKESGKLEEIRAKYITAE